MAGKGGGQSLDAQAATLEILRGLGKATATRVAGASSLSHSSTKHALTALRNGGYVVREQVVGSRAFMYWIDPSAPLELPRSPRRNRMRTQAQVLKVVKDAEGRITSTAIAKITGLARTTVSVHLSELHDKCTLSRHKPDGKKGYRYWIREGVDIGPLKVQDEDALWWAPITEALARTRPTWKMPPPPPTDTSTSLLSGFEKRRQESGI